MDYQNNFLDIIFEEKMHNTNFTNPNIFYANNVPTAINRNNKWGGGQEK